MRKVNREKGYLFGSRKYLCPPMKGVLGLISPPSPILLEISMLIHTYGF